MSHFIKSGTSSNFVVDPERRGGKTDDIAPWLGRCTNCKHCMKNFARTTGPTLLGDAHPGGWH